MCLWCRCGKMDDQRKTKKKVMERGENFEKKINESVETT